MASSLVRSSIIAGVLRTTHAAIALRNAHEPFRAGVDRALMSRDIAQFLFSIACAAIVLCWLLFVMLFE